MSFNISSMLNESVYDHSVDELQLIETHISWVVLTGAFAYKIKKPVNFGFLDFSTLELRHRYCKQELTLNSRLAPDIYLDVVPISGSPDAPSISEPGTPFEYAVKMRQFPQESQLDRMLETGKLSFEHMDALANVTAKFHQSTGVAQTTVDYGDPELVHKPVVENFTQIHEHIHSKAYDDVLAELSQWSQQEYSCVKSILQQRKQDGFIRQCHGDMHLRNLIWFNNQPMAFDCIEFNDYLSWIDVISEVAFLIMDLQSRHQYQLANRFTNSYLEQTGDYAGLRLMRFYLSYRALVRAKVDALRIEQADISEGERQATKAEFESYLTLARSYAKKNKPGIIIMHGLSGAGKSTVSQQLVDEFGYIRIRSDVERKRMFNLDSHSDTSNEINAGLYSSQISEQTYARLSELSEVLVSANYRVIVDATFLKHSQRKQFELLAESLQVPYIILGLTAPVEVLRERVANRESDVSDANLAVLDNQILNLESFEEYENEHLISIDTGTRLDLENLKDQLDKVHI